MSKRLEEVRVAILAADGVEQIELTRPMKKLRSEGAEVEVISLRSGSIRAMNLMKRGRRSVSTGPCPASGPTTTMPC